ncbi:hypothetical protein MWU60_01805 [Yoonia sp. F2084L]|uniref:hypothetical protein n=1 Tax=Yoonia sp. F2084L TaxID=2926419 RepID=UPI001FF4DDBF|nr:hypothetical protein [Yoonia sp. F2084L]MCK0094291.1 hypothetical protein [Yoonia sp. F2084L]
MVVVDFQKYAQKQATQPQAGFVANADMVLAISIRCTTLSMAFRRPVGAVNDTLKVASRPLLTRG